jgi:hypothetical protein
MQSEKLFNKLFANEVDRSGDDLPESARNHQGRNFFSQVFALSLTKTGDQFMDPKITLAWLLPLLSVPGAFLSLLVPIHNTFSLLPQMLVAHYLRRSAIRKWYWVAGSLGQCLALLSMSVVAMLCTGVVAGIGIVVSLLMFSLCRGVCSVAQKDVLGKTVVKTRRGRVSGYTESIAGVSTLVLAVYLLFSERPGLSVIIPMLLIAALCWLLSAISFARIVEPDNVIAEDDETIAGLLSQFAVLRTHREFRKFVLVRSALLGSALAAPYLVTLAQSSANGSLSMLGSLLLAASLASFLSGSTWGVLADRSSARCMTIAGLLAAAAGAAAVMVSALAGDSGVLYALCLFALYLAHAGVRVGRKTHLVDMTDHENRSTLVAVSNTLIGLMLLVLAVFGALVSQLHDYAGLLFFSMLAALGALLSASLRPVQN